MGRLKLLSLILIFLLLPSITFAFDNEEIETFFNQLKIHAKEYEDGKLSFLQLRIYSEIISEKIRRKISDSSEIQMGDKKFEGTTATSVEKIFGPPTEMTNWVWIVNQDKSTRLDETVARWEKKIYKGSKIKIRFNAWPQIFLKEDNTILLFYWIGFETDFVEEEPTFNMDEIISNLKIKAENYYKTKTGADGLVKKMIESENILMRYMEANREDCNNFIQDLVKGERMEQNVIKKESVLYNGENFDIILHVNECEDCEWNWLHMDYWLEPIRKDYALMGEKMDIKFNRKMYQELDTYELYYEIEELLLNLKLKAALHDLAKSNEFTRLFHETQSKINIISEVLNEKLNDWNIPETERERLEIERSEKIQYILESVAEQIKMERIKQIESKKKIFEVKETVQNSYCRGDYEDCGSKNMICNNAQCVPGKENQHIDNVNNYNPIIENVINEENEKNNVEIENEINEEDEYDPIIENDVNEDITDCQNNAGSCAADQAQCESYCSSKGEVFNNLGEGYIECGDWKCCFCHEETPTGNFLNDLFGITGYATSDYEDFGFDCSTDNDCSTEKCRLNKCSTGNGEGESCEDHFWCESEICDNGICRGGGPASQFCGNGACDQEEETEGMYHCSEDCDVVEDCQTGCCLEENPEAACGGPCNICDYNTGECRPSNAPECQEEINSDICNNNNNCDNGLGENHQICPNDCYCGNGECDNDENIENCPMDCGNPGEECNNNNFCDTWENQGNCPNDCKDQNDDNGGEDYSCLKEGCRHPTKICNVEKGWCDCIEGTWDCDGDDWINGCESNTPCKPCTSDNDCAAARCSEGNWGVEKFTCEQGDSWEQDKGAIEIGAGCGFRQSGEIDAWFWISGWGEMFDELDSMKRELRAQSEENWCRKDYDNGLKMRLEIQKSFESDLKKWLFEDLIEKTPEDFDIHMRTIGGAFWSLVDSNRKIAENMQCLHKNDWSEEITPVSIDIDSEYGKIKIWEEWVETDYFGETMMVLTPYMEMWVFPPKEIMKQIIKKESIEGKMGPDGEKPGPTPAEIAEMKQSEEMMGIIKRLSDNFGGDGKFIFQVKDGDERIFGMLFHVNPEIVMEVDILEGEPEDVDAYITMSFDFFYDMASADMKHAHMESPEWAKRDFEFNIDDIGNAISTIIKIIGGVASGGITVEPSSAWGNILFSIQSFMQMMMQAI